MQTFEDCWKIELCLNSDVELFSLDWLELNLKLIYFVHNFFYGMEDKLDLNYDQCLKNTLC